MNRIKKLLNKHPNLLIYYTDNGSWSIYTSRKDFNKLDELEGEEFDNHLKNITLLEGSNAFSHGYASDLVLELSNALGIEVDSC